jgi:hypothetical protein
MLRATRDVTFGFLCTFGKVVIEGKDPYIFVLKSAGETRVFGYNWIPAGPILPFNTHNLIQLELTPSLPPILTILQETLATLIGGYQTSAFLLPRVALSDSGSLAHNTMICRPSIREHTQLI